MNCIGEINDTQVDNTKDIDAAMPMYNLIWHNYNYFKTSGILYQLYRDESPLNNVAITKSKSFKFKSRLLNNTNGAGIINAEITVSLKYLCNFWKTLDALN